jgi:hypothetical protein
MGSRESGKGIPAESTVRDMHETRDFVCHMLQTGVPSNIQIRGLNSPSWAQAAGISWRAPERTVTTIRKGKVIRLVLRGITGDAKEVEWNPETYQVILRRTELWSKPFYFYLVEGELVVSDSLRSIMGVLPEWPQLNRLALQAYLTLESFPSPLTPFWDIYKVGVEETCTLNVSTQKKEWTTNPLPERFPSGLEKGVEDVREALREVIEMYIRQSQDELVLLCSGGLDSTILAHLLNGHGRALVLSYIDSWKDEVERARQTAGHAKLSLQETQLPPFSPERFSAYVDLLDEPSGGTCGYAITHLCEAVLPGSCILSGHGTGTLSLMNFNHKHLRDSLYSGVPNMLTDRFSQCVSYIDRETLRRLLEDGSAAQVQDPVKVMVERELPIQKDMQRALHAVIRRQLCVAEETTQLWPIYEFFGHTPLLPFFEPRVRMVMDRLPELVLRNEQYERRLLNELAMRYCPGYVPPLHQLGYGIPLGLPGYPNENSLAEVVSVFSHGPLSDNGLHWMLNASRRAVGHEKFYWLRRLWAAVLLHAWLDRNLGAGSSSRRNRTI